MGIINPSILFGVPLVLLSSLLELFPTTNWLPSLPNRKREAALLSAAQDGQLQIIAQAGHVCNLDQPEAFTQQVRTFAKRLKTATSN